MAVAQKYELYKYARFGTSVTRATWDEEHLRWRTWVKSKDERTRCLEIATSLSQTLLFPVLASSALQTTLIFLD